MNKIKKLCVILFFASCSLVILAQEQKEERNITKKNEIIQSHQAPLEYTDFKTLTLGQKKHLELYRQQQKMRMEGTYTPRKCFVPIYTPMVEFANQLRSIFLKSAENAQKIYEKSMAEKKIQLAKRMQAQYNTFINVAKQCEVVEKAFKDRKKKELDDALVILLRQIYVLTQDGVKIPKRDWLTQKEADFILGQFTQKQKVSMTHSKTSKQGNVVDKVNIRAKDSKN